MNAVATHITAWQAVLVVANYALALALLWSCLCRFTHTTKHRTRPTIRWAFNLLALASVVALVAPLAQQYTGGWLPDAMHVLLMLAITAVQIVTAWHWKHGVPPAFRTDSERAALQAEVETVDRGELL